MWLLRGLRLQDAAGPPLMRTALEERITTRGPLSTQFQKGVSRKSPKSQQILRRVSVRSHTSLLVILVIRARPDKEGGHIGAGTE